MQRAEDDQTTIAFIGGEILAGKYRVEKIIGQGGMGVVLAAEHLVLHQKVAIKLLHEAGLGHTDVVGRFMREARAAVRLRSEHVARVIDVGTLEDGRPFIVMERLEGQDLGDVIDHTRGVPVATAVDYVLQACEAIAEAHAAGIVHRDLKPKNLFLTKAVHGRALVKVLDFGISKVDPARSPQEMQLTKTTEVIGSPSYMSPEQLRSSRNVDARTDIWALGVILYELLTGRLPFYADTVTELVVVIVTEREQGVQTFRPDVPDALAAIVSRCLQKQPEHRYQSVIELVQALEPFAPGVGATVTERIRAVASSGTIPPTLPSGPGVVKDTTPIAPDAYPASPSAGAPPAGAPPASPSSRVNVHGGTSVAWGETQSQVGMPPYAAPPPSSRVGLIAGLVLGGLVVASGAVAGTLYFGKRPPAPADGAVATGGASAMPLPEGRKDLPPLPSAGTGAAPSASVVADPPAASTLPETRNPPPQPTPAKVAPHPTTPVTPPKGRPTAPKPEPKADDLSNIGRR